MLFNMDLMGIIGVITAFLILGGLLAGFGSWIIKKLSIETGNQLELDKIDDNSDIKKHISKTNESINKLNKNLQKLLDLQEDSYWERKELYAHIISNEIKEAVKYKEPPSHVIEKFEHYKNIPTQDKRKRNGHLNWIVKDYCRLIYAEKTDEEVIE